MKLIKARGIVSNNILNSNAIYRYDFKTGKFNEYDKNKLYRLFNRVYLNSYDKQYSLSSIINELPQVDFNQVGNYYRYTEALQNQLNLDDMETEIEYYLKLNNENKKDFSPIRWKPESQVQHLINNDVFTNGRLLCQYKSNNKSFDYISPENVIKLFRNVKNKDYLSQRGLMDNYIFFIRNLTNIKGLYDDLIQYHENQRILNQYRQDYEAIKSIIETFN